MYPHVYTRMDTCVYQYVCAYVDIYVYFVHGEYFFKDACCMKDKHYFYPKLFGIVAIVIFLVPFCPVFLEQITALSMHV